MSIFGLRLQTPLEYFCVNAIHRHRGSVNLLEWNGSNLLPAPSNTRFDNLMKPVSILRLQNAYIPVDHSVYHGLVELSLISDGKTQLPTPAQMAQALSACPELKRLVLKNVYAKGNHGHPDPGSVRLLKLSYLDLECTKPRNLVPLLKMLQPAGQRLTLRISLSDEPEFIENFHAFTDRCMSISDTIIKPAEPNVWFGPLNSYAPKLTKLTLENCDFGDSNLGSYSRKEFAEGSILWPHLHSLILNRCKIDPSLLEVLTGSRYLEIIKFWNCEVKVSYSHTPVQATESMFKYLFAHSDVIIIVHNDD
ncbi:F-box-like protein [Ceratobasidium sp. AG-Ba]|nr:F-box-like protein [Ceratobasidium sp. AG-Ba]